MKFVVNVNANPGVFLEVYVPSDWIAECNPHSVLESIVAFLTLDLLCPIQFGKDIDVLVGEHNALGGLFQFAVLRRGEAYRSKSWKRDLNRWTTKEVGH